MIKIYTSIPKYSFGYFVPNKQPTLLIALFCPKAYEHNYKPSVRRIYEFATNSIIVIIQTEVQDELYLFLFCNSRKAYLIRKPVLELPRGLANKMTVFFNSFQNIRFSLLLNKIEDRSISILLLVRRNLRLKSFSLLCCICIFFIFSVHENQVTKTSISKMIFLALRQTRQSSVPHIINSCFCFKQQRQD